MSKFEIIFDEISYIIIEIMMFGFMMCVELVMWTTQPITTIILETLTFAALIYCVCFTISNMIYELNKLDN